MPREMQESPPPTRSARKRRAILDAATDLFLESGYQGTSMDHVAAVASVSKQTLYKHFAGKGGLFAAMLDELTERVAEFVEEATLTLQQTDDLEGDLQRLARAYLATVMKPEVLRLRRLVIGEAGRLPEMARAYHDRVPERTLEALTAGFEGLIERGQLRPGEPRDAASHFAFLVLGAPLDRTLFLGDAAIPDDAELERLAAEGARAFLAGHRAR